MIITRHAEERGKERVGLSKSAIKRLAFLALERGVTHADTTGKLKRLFDSLYFRNKEANNIRIYAEKIFIFSDQTLITILPLSNEYKGLAAKVLAKK